MSRLCVIVALLGLSACRYTLDDPEDPTARSCTDGTVAACTEAATHSDLAWIEANVFPKCTFSGCHNGAATDAGRLDLQPGKSFAALVNKDSEIATGPTLTGKAKLVVPGQPNQSYLLVMMQALPPAEFSPPLDEPPAAVGYMPQGTGGVPSCCQKLDALTRWVMDGALDN